MKKKQSSTEKKTSSGKSSKTAAERSSAPLKARLKARFKASAHWTLWTGAKLTLALMFVLAIYLMYLDAKVTRQFEGKKWQIPAQIYARPLTLSVGFDISKQALIDELETLHYRKVDKLRGAGEYTVSPKHLSVVKRAFDFPAKTEPERWLTVEFVDGRVSRLTDRDSHQDIQSISFEPLLIDRLLSPHHEDREFTPLDAFPELFKDTLLLVEDRDFYHHHGVSLSATLRALWHNIRAGRTVEGGSTLTQQLAKNFYLNADRTLLRKVNEAFIALLLDHRYSKDQLLEAYVNEVFLGQFHNRAIHGFGLASRFYFSKPINELKPQEFAVLVAIIKGPSYYNPRRHKARALNRRDLILRMMFEKHLLDKNEYRFAVNQRLGISDKKEFVPSRYPAYIAEVKRELKSAIRDSDILSDGIKVFTNLEPRTQQALETVVERELPSIEKTNAITGAEAAAVSVDIKEAGITAMVGGRHPRYSGFNRALDLKRNIGSLIKPAVYLTALSDPDEYTLATPLKDEPITMSNQHGKQWSPENFDKRYLGQVPLIEALSHSRNIPTVNLGMALGVDSVADTLRDLGVKGRITPYPSLFLGALELSPLEVAQMYHTFADKGVYRKLSTLRAITGNDGVLIWQRAPVAAAKFDVASIYLTNVALKQVTSKGTARYLKQLFPNTVFAGKTGTTDELRDSWFTGFDDKNLTTFWVGKDDYSPVGLTGSAGALRLFAALYRLIPAYSIPDIRPGGVVERYFAPSGKMYPGECAGAIGLPAIEAGRPEMVDCQR